MKQFIKSHKISTILGVIGLLFPLLGFIETEIFRILFIFNPLGLLFGFFFLNGAIGNNEIAGIASLAILTSVFYFLIGLLIELMISSKRFRIIFGFILIGIVALMILDFYY